MTQTRFSIKIAGASGQGINVLGEILSKTLKREGFNVFGYREYPSIIKGGHATYQIDIAETYIASLTSKVDLVMILNSQATNWHLTDLKEDSLIVHSIDNPRINTDEYKLMKEKNIKLIYIPSLNLSTKVGGNYLTSNIVSLGSIWKVLELKIDNLISVIEETFSDKPELVPIDIACVKEGYNYSDYGSPSYTKRLLKEDEITEDEKSNLHLKELSSNKFTLKSNPSVKDSLLISGNEALGIGIINAGARMFFTYPMTPTSSILTFLANNEKESGMIVKQVEDEITAAAMVVGAMHAGTRSLTATSGGGFDLMTEHISLAAITEVPFVCILGQRPGPATGMPTWTAQGDLLLSVFSGHGEYSKCIIGIKDPEDAFYSIQEAFNIAEKYQIPVIVLTDKYIGESIFTTSDLDENKVKIERGIVTDKEELMKLKSEDRYKLTENGISKRWLPGSMAPDYDANSDEHDEMSNSTEEEGIAGLMISKRLRKQETLLNELNDPEIYSNNVDSKEVINIIGWGSTYNVIHDIFPYFTEKNIRINYLHIKYLWPLKVEQISKFIDENTILVEGNHNAQLGQLIRMQTGIEIKNKLLKWNGRPFYVEEVVEYIKKLI